MASQTKGKKAKDGSALVDEAQQRRERVTLAVLLLGAVAIVLGMIVLSNFLSGGVDKVNGNKPVFYAFLAFAAVTVAGIGYKIVTKPKHA